MRQALIIADFGSGWFTALTVLLATPILLAITSFAIGLGRAKRSKSTCGAVLGMISLAVVAFLIYSGQDWSSPLTYILFILPIPLDIAGVFMSLRKQNEN